MVDHFNALRLAELASSGLRRRDTLAMLAGAGSAAVFGLPAFGQEAPRKGGVLKIASAANPSSLDPMTGGSGLDHSFLWTIYDTLVEWDYESLKPKPGIAKWSFPDPKTMVLDIEPNILFHDGTACDAAAVKFNLDRLRQDQRSNVKADLASISGVETTGPLQVTLRLANPDTALPAIFSDRAGMMVSPKAAQASGAEFDRKPVGAGPWSFVSWADNQSMIVKRNDKYWRANRPYLDGIEFAIIPEIATGLRSVVAGQNDMAYQVAARQKPIIDRAKNLTAVTHPTLYCLQIYFNYARPPLDNPKVRQAINFALDRATFVKATLGGLGEPAYMALPSTHWAYDTSVAALYPYDPDRSKKLLAEAGFPNGLDVTIGGYSDQDSARRGEVVLDQLGKVGIRLKFTNGTIPEISAQFFGNEKRFDALLSAWTGRPDPSMTYSLMFGKGAYYNAGRSEASPELSNMLQESRASEDIATRTEIFAKIQRLVMEQALVAPLAFQFELDALSERTKGYRPNLLGKPKFEDVWLKV
jgi:peptide/nickel transport system permease protein/peptide/nickel transport system substrate-binding protein